jgi:hypothetical protein
MNIQESPHALEHQGDWAAAAAPASAGRYDIILDVNMLDEYSTNTTGRQPPRLRLETMHQAAAGMIY